MTGGSSAAALVPPATMPPGGPATRGPLTREALLQRRDAPAHVIGAVSAEGVAVTRLLLRLGFSDMFVHDMRPRAELRRAFRTTHGAYSRHEQDELWDELSPLFEAGRFGDEYLRGVDAAAEGSVVLGQGWYLDARNRNVVRGSIPHGALVTSMSELYVLFAPGPVAGITGTNGKSTTVALVEHLLSTGGVEHRTAGNERSSRQFLPDILDVPAGTWSLLEVSNRQLMQLVTSPDVAAITALTPDHLEEHGGWDGYRAAKRVLFAHQQEGAVAIANADDAEALAAASAGAGTLVRCGVAVGTGGAAEEANGRPGVSWRADALVAVDVPVFGGASLEGERTVANSDDLQLPGEHNRRNSAVAVAVALAMGAEPESIAAALSTFRGKALRMEHVATIDGVEVISDIKSTTPEATIAALQALGERPVVLVAGGEDKGLAYDSLAATIATTGAMTLLVPGSASDKLAAALERHAAPPERVDELAAALDRAFACAPTGAAVIVSPAAAGFWTSQLQGRPSLRALVRARTAVTDSSKTRGDTT